MRFKLDNDKCLKKLEGCALTLGENMADTLEIVLPAKLFGFESDELICVFSVDTGNKCIGVRLPISRQSGELIASGRLPGYLLSIDGSCRVELADGAGTVIKSTALPFSAQAASDVEFVYDCEASPRDSAYDIFRGSDGKSAYELACENGFSGSLTEWLDSLSVIMGKKIRSVAEVSRVDDTMVISYDDGSFDTFIISDGKDGAGVNDIEQVAAGSGSELLFHMDDGSTKRFSLPSGSDGSDGVPCSHTWSGSVLTITSASGTSSADLKGERGERGEVGAAGAKGDKGDKGDDGADGYTPVRGTDYWTAADIAAIKSYVDDAILSGEW